MSDDPLLRRGPGGKLGNRGLVEDLAFGASPNEFFEAVARDSPRGTFPRGFSREQTYWTIVGIDGGSNSGLLSEDGLLEVVFPNETEPDLYIVEITTYPERRAEQQAERPDRLA